MVGFKNTLTKHWEGGLGSGFPRGKHLTNPAGPRGAEQVSRQPRQQIQPELINNGTLSLRKNCEQWLGE